MEVMQKIELPMTEHKTIRYTLYLVREEEGTTETFCPPAGKVQVQEQSTPPLPTMSELRRMRVDLDLSQREAAYLLNMDIPSLSKYERGHYPAPESVRRRYWGILKDCRDGCIKYTRDPRVTLYDCALRGNRK